jgi:hypothetical protein
VRVASLVVAAAVIAQAPGAIGVPIHEREVEIARTGPQRLAPDATLLAGAAPFRVIPRDASSGSMHAIAEGGLSDLRLVSSRDGRVVPYLLVYPPIDEPQWRRAVVQLQARTEKTSGFEADLLSPQTIDAVRLEGLPRPFLKRALVEASGDREHWTIVVGEGTMFDLPDQQLQQTSLSFSPGTYRYVRVTWDDRNSGRVPPPAAVWARLASAHATPAPSLVPVQLEKRPSEPQRTRYHLTLPGARLPIVALRLAVGGTYVFRRAAVTEARLTAWQAEPVTIGRSALVREGTAGALRLPIQQPSQREIDLLIEDEANAPLDIQSVTAELAELPWIYFEADGPVTARYGDTGLAAPVYDLEAARASIDIERVPDAHWASASVETASPSASPLTSSGLPVAGAPLETSTFKYSREIAAGEAALVAVPLDAAALAHSAGPQGRFGDLRVVDRSDRQIPWLIEHAAEPLPLVLKAEKESPSAVELKDAAGRRLSVYRIALAFPHLPEASLVVRTDARVFRRNVRLGYERPADRRHRDPWFETFASMLWEHADPATASSALSVPLRPSDVSDVTMVVEEGDNSPLPIAGVQLLLPTYRLRFFRPASVTMRLLYGDDRVAPPSYDLALLAPRVLGAAATDASLAPEAGVVASAPGTNLVAPWIFWALIALAVVALLAVMVSLVRRSGG